MTTTLANIAVGRRPQSRLMSSFSFLTIFRISRYFIRTAGAFENALYSDPAIIEFTPE